MKSNAYKQASFIAAITFLVCFAACKTKKSVDQQIKQEELNPVSNTLGNVQVVKVEAIPEIPQIMQSVSDTAKCSMLVSFYSRGAGSDYEVIAELNRFLANGTSKNKKVPKFERIPWGREGEIDYCIQWNELSPDEKGRFEERVKQILNKSELVHISYNATCTHRR
jgi:hypothetical protein